MSFAEKIRKRAGDEAYSRIEKAADTEVGLAMQMPLRDDNHRPKYYTQRFLLGEFLAECESFKKAGLNILPTDLVDVLFKCKLLFAAKTHQEFDQRSGGFRMFQPQASALSWNERIDSNEAVVERHLDLLQSDISNRTLLSPIGSFESADRDANPQAFFEGLFAKLNFPFVCFFDSEHLVEKHKQFEPSLRVYDQASAIQFFSAPSFGFTVEGSRNYCFWVSSFWLRTFLNLLRIAGFVHPGQMDFGRDVILNPPTYPVFLGDHSSGCFQWGEDEKESWGKIPDGCLFLSFGYRGLSNMWLDKRTFPRIEDFFVNNKRILDCLQNPWNQKSVNDVSPTLDILSSATQIPDLGAKILLIYCCLEHLFVPKNASTENKKYIVGGMTALRPVLLPWFDRLYKLRCDYAHKGFVLVNKETRSLVRESVISVLALLVAKLSVS